jgi:toxin secretion/phage lysis holin
VSFSAIFSDGWTLEATRFYLFGDVKFLDALFLLMIIDIITGLIKAVKLKKLRSRRHWFGYLRKICVFLVIITANIIDKVLGLGGALTFATILSYILNEGLSITENLAQIGVKIPHFVKDKLHGIEEEVEKEEKKMDLEKRDNDVS